MKKILFVETLLDYKTSLAYARQNPELVEDLVVVNLNTYRMLDYTNTDLTYRIEDDYIQKDTLHGINEKAAEVGRDWCADTVLEPLLQWEGLNLGLVLESFLVRRLIMAYKYVILVKKILQREQCQDVLLIEHPQGIPKISSLLPANDEKIANDVVHVLRGQSSLRIALLPSLSSDAWSRSTKTPWTKRWVNPFANGLRIFANWALDKKKHRDGGKTIAMVGAPRITFSMIDQLEREADLRVIYFQNIFGPRLVPKLARKKICYKITEDYKNLGEQEERRRLYRDLEKRVSLLIKHDRFHAMTALDDLDVVPILEPHLRFAFEQFLPDVLINARRFQRFFKEEKIRAIVIDEALQGQFSRPFILSARNCGISSMEMQHGIPDDYAHQRLVTNKLALWGEYFKNRYVTESKLRPQDTVVTGSPALEDLKFRDFHRDSAMVRRKFRVDPKNRIVTLALPPFHRSSRGGIIDEHFTREQLESSIRHVLRAIDSLNDVHLFIKLHPTEPNSEDMRVFVKRSGFAKPCSVLHIFGIHPLIMSSEVLLSLGSTVILEAMAMKTPVVLINFVGKSDPNPYAQWGALRSALRPEDLQEMIRDILADKKGYLAMTVSGREKVLREFGCGVDAQSAKRFVQAVRHLCDAVTIEDNVSANC